MCDYRLPASCIVVEGARRSCIYDLQKKSYHFIPNTLAEILTTNPYFNIKSLSKDYGEENIDILQSYISVLREKYLIIDLDKKINLPSLPSYNKDFLTFDNCFIRIEKCEITPILFEVICKSRAKHLHIIIKEVCSVDDLKTIFRQLNEIQSVEVFFETNVTHEQLYDIVESNLNIRRLFIYNSSENECFSNSHPDMGDIFYLKERVRNCSCGNICQEYFSINFESYNKAKVANTCLHGKLGIDEYGEYCNCPFMITRCKIR